MPRCKYTLLIAQPTLRYLTYACCHATTGTPAEVLPGHIGVMATYRKQVRKVRLLLRQRGLGEVRVGTVDDYQVGGGGGGRATCWLLGTNC